MKLFSGRFTLKTMKNSRRVDLLVLPAYLFLSVLASFPLIFKFGTHVAGNASGTDMIGHLWHCWWFGKAVFEGSNPYYAYNVLFPAGSTDLLAKSGSCFNAFSTVALQPIFDNIVASYNATMLFFMTFNAYAAYRLLLYLTRNGIASFLAGAIFLANPFFITELTDGRIGQYSMGWCLFFLLFLLKTLKEKGTWNPIIAAIFLGIATASYLGNVILLSIFSILLLFYFILSDRKSVDKKLLLRLLVLGAVFFILISPLFTAFLFQSEAPDSQESARVDFPVFNVADSIRDFSLSENTIIRNSVTVLSRRWPLLKLSAVFLVLVLAGLFYKNKLSGFWLLISLVFFLLALGPYLHLSGAWPEGGQDKFYPLPGLLFYKVFPFSSRFRFPSRFLSMFWLSLSVLSGLGLAVIVDRSKTVFSGRLKIVPSCVAVAITGLLLLEQHARDISPFPLALSTFPRIPSYYTDILADEEDCAIMGIPLSTRKPTLEEEKNFPVPKWQSLEMLYQTAHHKSIMAGLWVSVRPPQAYHDFISGNSLIQNVLRWQEAVPDLPIPVLVQDLEIMKELGLKYIVVANDWLRPDPAGRIEHYLVELFGSPEHYPDGGIDVYDIRRTGPAFNNSLHGGEIHLRCLDWK